jgi:hypothetical protein
MRSRRWGFIGSTAAMVIVCGFVASAARAGYVVTLVQQGPNVVASGSGAIDLAGLTLFLHGGFGGSELVPNTGLILTGNLGVLDGYSGFSGPASFGSSSQAAGFNGGADLVGIIASANELIVPINYVSGNPLSDSATYPFQTFSSLGVTPGTFEWTWGNGANQNFTLKIGAAGVPDDGSSLALFAIGLVCSVGFKFAQRRAM